MHSAPFAVKLGFMRKPRNPAACKFSGWERRRLFKALARARGARLFRRIQAVLLATQGRTPIEITRITGLSRRAVYYSLARYLRSHQIEALAEQPHPGRPPGAPELTRGRILRELRRSPLRLGYRTNVWTVRTLADRLSEHYHTFIGPWALRQRMKQAGLTCKRPRYFYSERAPHVAQKKGGHRGENEGHAAQRRVAF